MNTTLNNENFFFDEDKGIPAFWGVIGEDNLSKVANGRINTSLLLPGDIILFAPRVSTFHQKVIAKWQWTKYKKKSRRGNHAMWTHVGLYLGDDEILDAVYTNKKTNRKQIDKINIHEFIKGGYIRARRFYKTDSALGLQGLECCIDLTIEERGILVKNAISIFQNNHYNHRYSPASAIIAAATKRTKHIAGALKGIYDKVTFNDIFNFNFSFWDNNREVLPAQLTNTKEQWYCASLISEVFNRSNQLLPVPNPPVPADFSAAIYLESIPLRVKSA